MNLNLGEILEDTQKQFSFLFDNFKKNHPLSEKDLINAKENNYEVTLVTYFPDMLTLSATAGIYAYHNHLRRKLLENGIDIGELE